MSNELLEFFYQRSDLIKSVFALTQSNESAKIVANFYFIVSNVKTDEDNTIKFNARLGNRCKRIFFRHRN